MPNGQLGSSLPTITESKFRGHMLLCLSKNDHSVSRQDLCPTHSYLRIWVGKEKGVQEIQTDRIK